MVIREIIERKDVLEYLKARLILDQYKKAKNFILLENLSLVNLKKRKPKSDGVWYFRINKKYRAFCYIEDDILVVFEINDHQ